MFTEMSKRKNYNPLGAKLQWVEATQVVRIPRVACFDSFFIEKPVNPLLNHVHHHEWPVPLGL